jgi:pantoate--beta-alanine ligase
VEAPRLYHTLHAAAQRLQAGEKNLEQIQQEAVKWLNDSGWQPEYVAIRALAGLGIPVAGEKKLVILAAARLGATRLIDNLEVCLSVQAPI